MINLLIVCHGNMAEGLVDAMSLIIGPQEGIQTIGLRETDAIDGLIDRVQTAITELDQGDGVLILVDILGASPFNVSARIALESDQLEVVTGVNLPMLLETAMAREGSNIKELAATAKQAGAGSIVILSERMQSG